MKSEKTIAMILMLSYMLIKISWEIEQTWQSNTDKHFHRQSVRTTCHIDRRDKCLLSSALTSIEYTHRLFSNSSLRFESTKYKTDYVMCFYKFFISCGRTFALCAIRK